MHSEEEISKAVDDVLSAISGGIAKNEPKFIKGINVIALLEMNEAQRVSLKEHPIEILTELNLLKTPKQIALGKRILTVHFLVGHGFRDTLTKTKTGGKFLVPVERASLEQLESFLKQHLPKRFKQFSELTVPEIRETFSREYTQIIKEVKAAIARVSREVHALKRQIRSHDEPLTDLAKRLRNGRSRRPVPKNRPHL